jgi:hypothetical protein
VQTAENLVRNQYCEFKSVVTKTIDVETGDSDRTAKRAKLFITLKKSKDFGKVMENFRKITEENKKLAEKYEGDK